MPPNRRLSKAKIAETYEHPEADLAMRPEVGTQAQFKKKKPPQKYRFDSSLSPQLEWDGQNPARELGETLINQIAEYGLKIAELAKSEASPKRDKEIENLKSKIANCRAKLRQISGAFLNWSGKAERLSFDVPTLPLFVHERLSTKAIIETLKGHRSDKQEDFFRELYCDPIQMEVDHQSGNDVPAWFLDTDYNGLCFHVTQAFFPKTGAWENLKKALKAGYEESVWDHLAGTISAPFAAGEHGQVAVKVIDQRGNELLVVKSLKDGK